MRFILKLYIVAFTLTLCNFKVSAQTKKQLVSKVKKEIKKNKSEVLIDTLNKFANRIFPLDTTFKFAGLKKPLKIQIYLPKNYSLSAKRYPVIYFPEGAYIFNDTIEEAQWQLNIIFDSLEAARRRTAIIVAVDAGIKNIGIYESLFNENDTTQMGNQFVNFLSDSLKPFIDKNYRTLSDRKNTLIAGAGLNANLSYLAFLSRNETFGKAGLFSPSFALAPSLDKLTDSLAKSISGKLFYYYGEKEDDPFQEKTEEIISNLGEKSSALIYNLTDTEGWGSAVFYKKYFSAFIIWALAEGNNSIINIKN